MKWATITFTGVTSPLGGQSAGNYIHGPMPSPLRPFYVAYTAAGWPYAPGYYTQNTFPPDLTTTQPSLQYHQMLYVPVVSGGGSRVAFYGGYFDKTSGTYQAGWAVFEGSSAFEGTLMFTNDVDGGTGTALVELHDDETFLSYTDQRSSLIAPDFAWGWDGFVWRWIAPGEVGYADLIAAGGGRYHQNIVAVSHGKVYYGSVT